MLTFGYAARVLLLVVVGGLGLICFIFAHRSKDGSLSPGWWSAVPYWLGAMVCMVGLAAPGPRWRRPLWEGGPSHATLVVLAGAALMLLGAIIRLVLSRQGRLTGSLLQRVGPPLAVLVVVGMGGLQRLASPVPMMVFASTAVLVVVGWFVYSYVQARNSPSARMTRLINEGRPAEALGVGESIPPDRRDVAVQHNLATARCNMGDTAGAKALFTELAARGNLTDHHRVAIDDWLRKIAAQEASPGATTDAT
jgi:hypothetical protein